jgi:hypothetical protein
LALQSTEQSIERGIAPLLEGIEAKATRAIEAIEAKGAEEADEAREAMIAVGECEAVA